MKLRHAPGEGPWGATLPVELVPETTDDDDLEEQAVEWLQLYHFPAGGFRTHCGRAWPLPGARHQRPDIVTLVANTETVVFVGDAKRHKRLQKRAVEKVVEYRKATKAECAAVFVPAVCRIDESAVAYATKQGIDIVRLGVAGTSATERDLQPYTVPPPQRSSARPAAGGRAPTTRRRSPSAAAVGERRAGGSRRAAGERPTTRRRSPSATAVGERRAGGSRRAVGERPTTKSTQAAAAELGAVMTDDEVTEWIRLVKAGSHGVIIKRLPVASSISGRAQAGAAGSRNRIATDNQGNCQVELWRVPRPMDEKESPETIMEATHAQTRRFVDENAAVDRRNT